MSETKTNEPVKKKPKMKKLGKKKRNYKSKIS